MERKGTGEWRTVTVELPEAAFPNQNCHCDLRITSWGWAGGEDVLLHRIELTEK